MHLSFLNAAHKPAQVASWLRKDYPRSAPARGHSYLIALCGSDCTAR